MNNLRNALEQLKRRANGQCETVWPREAQALLHERDALRQACDAAMEWSAGFPLGIASSKPDIEAAADVYRRCRAALGVRLEDLGQKEVTMMTLTEYVEKQIVKLFDDVAEKVGKGEFTLNVLSDDEWAGIPPIIFKAQEYMIQCWRKFVNKEEA